MSTQKQLAASFGCTVEQARAGLLRNAAQLRSMVPAAQKAEAAGRRYRGGLTAAYLQERAEAFERAAIARAEGH